MIREMKNNAIHTRLQHDLMISIWDEWANRNIDDAHLEMSDNKEDE